MLERQCVIVTRIFSHQSVYDVVDMLHTEEIPDDQTALPSPEDLSGYILVKVVILLLVVTNTLTGHSYPTEQRTA